MERLTKGTKEFLIVPIVDSLGNVTQLESVTYDIYTGDDPQTPVLQGANASTDGMTVFALVDTTDLEIGVYELYIQFEIYPEIPRLGPFRFKVDQ